MLAKRATNNPFGWFFNITYCFLVNNFQNKNSSVGKYRKNFYPFTLNQSVHTISSNVILCFALKKIIFAYVLKVSNKCDFF